MALPANITDTAPKYNEPGWRDGRDKGETASFIFGLCKPKRKKKKLNKKEHIYVLILFLHRQGDREQRESGKPNTKQMGEDSRKERQQMSIKLPC